MTPQGDHGVTYQNVEAAAARISGFVRHTPLLESEALNAATGARVLVKPEPLQRTGSFKIRGALNAVAQIEGEAVVAFSSGNHAQGVAAAARHHGKRATIVMPKDAPQSKIEGTRAWGAEVILYDRYREERERIGAEISAETGAALIRPYDDARVITGQATVGLEIARDASARGISIDSAIVCCGGGGLIAGCAIALKHHFPTIEVWAAEPAGFDDTARSLRDRRRVVNAPGARTLCDALMAATPGELTFTINARLLAGGTVVTDTEVETAMRFAFRHFKVVVEPGGAVALAALLAGRLDVRDRTVAVVLSGGNVDEALFGRVLADA